MPVLMSIRTIHVDNILCGAKRIEFRKRFPTNYVGTIVVYECGEGSQHKVVAKFKTENPIKVDPTKGVSKSVIDILKSRGCTDFDIDVLKRMQHPIVCIPIYEPVRIATCTLQEFSAKYKTIPTFTRPPQSWQYFKCGAVKKDK